MEDKSCIISIEASIGGGSIALTADDELIAGWDGGNGRSRSEDVLPAIHDLLHRANISVDRIKTICVGAGPGSFTGIRIGIATALGLARSLGIPAVKGDILSAMASMADGHREVIATVPLGRGYYAFRRYTRSCDGKIDHTPIKAIDEKGLVDIIGTSSDSIVVLPNDVELTIVSDALRIDNLAFSLASAYARSKLLVCDEPIFISKP